MIWLRRAVAVFLTLLFIILFIPIILIFRVNDTLGNPDFYIRQLRQADIYNFVYDDVMPAAIGQLDITPDNQELNISSLKTYIPGMVKQTIPPEWLQAQTEQTIKGVLPYVLGDTSGFRLDVPLKERVKAGAQAVKNTLHAKGVSDSVYGRLVALLAQMTSRSAGQMPIPLDQASIESLVRQVFPPEWLLKQIDTAIDEVIPYFTKDKESFALKISLSDRLDAMGVALVNILVKQEVYDYLMKEFPGQMMKQSFQGGLPGGITFTDDELATVLKQLLPVDVYRAQVPAMVGQVVAYLKGTQETIEFSIPLAGGKQAAANAFGKMIDQKLEAKYNSLPVGSASQLASFLQNLSLTSFPQFRLPGVSYSDLKNMLGLDISSLFVTLMVAVMPDQLKIDAMDFFGGKDGNPLIQARQWFQNGFSYTDANLQRDLGSGFQTVQNARQWIDTGFTFNENDLRQAIKSAGGNNGNEQLQTFDSVRSQVGTVRSLRMLVWIIPILLLLCIGLLGGRRWSSKLIWAAAALALASIIIFIIFGHVFSFLVQPKIAEVLSQTPPDKLAALFASKGGIIARNMVDSFIGGIRLQGALLFVVALAGLITGSFWHIRQRENAD